MRSFFLKIFLWFGLAMVLVNVGAFVTGFLTDRGPRTERRMNPLASVFAIYAQTAAEMLERDGPDALAAYLERVERASRIRALLLDERGAEVLGRVVPGRVREVAARTSESTPFAFDDPGEHQQALAAQLVRSPQGARYTLVGQLPEGEFPPLHGPPLPQNFHEPGGLIFFLHILLGPRHLTVLLIGALFCYWLARHLTTPLVKLRDTTRELADGNLSARVGESLTRRYDEIGYLGRDFNLMAGRIESLVEAQRRLLRDISHELRSPLTRLGVALQLVRRRAGPEIEQGLDRIEREAESINQMIGQLLSLSRLETGTDRLNNVRINLCTLLQEVADDADFEARSRNRSVRVRLCEPCSMTGVAELLRSAVENVLRNAVHYTAEGTEVEISLRLERQETAKSEAVISVRDHGKGVPQAALDEIFRPFYRVEDARDRQTGGTGLGLAIAARAVRLHGGHISAANAEDGGLIVQLRLPIGNA